MYGETEDTNLAKQNRASFNNKQIPTTFAVKSKKKHHKLSQHFMPKNSKGFCFQSTHTCYCTKSGLELLN